MILKVFAILDTKANAFLAPFTTPTNGLATRILSDAVNDPTTMVARHPRDFRLGVIGTFDDNNGQLTAAPIEWLGYAYDYLNKPGGDPALEHHRSAASVARDADIATLAEGYRRRDAT